MGKVEQDHLYKEFKASQETMPGCDYVYLGKPTPEDLFLFIIGNINKEMLKNGDIVIGIDTQIPGWVVDNFLNKMQKTRFSDKLIVSDDGKTILVKGKKKGGEGYGKSGNKNMAK